MISVGMIGVRRGIAMRIAATLATIALAACGSSPGEPTPPNVPDAMTSFQILGGLFARDCNHATNRYRYRLLWLIPLGANEMR